MKIKNLIVLKGVVSVFQVVVEVVSTDVVVGKTSS